jgi:GNAT superfamily N-acetyltransferase
MLIIRPGEPKDINAIFDLMKGLAAYEQLSAMVSGSTELLHAHLFGDRPYAETIVAELDNVTIGFALFFHTYSTFLTQPGLHLEDIFILPEYRRQGVGKALITQVIKIANDRGCGRLEWSVLEWNQSAIEFYQRLGATILPEWQICRMEGAILTQAASYGSLERGEG